MKKLPNSIYSKKQYRLTVLLIIIAFVILFLTSTFFEDTTYYTLILFIELFTLFFLLIKINPFFKLVKAVEKDLSYQKYEELVNKILQENLNEEMRNYVNILHANYTALKDVNKSIEIFETTHPPFIKQYQNFYYVVKGYYFFNKQDFERAKEYISELNNPKLKNVVNMFKLKIEIEQDQNIRPDVEKHFKYDTKNKLVNISNLAFLQEYFYKRDDIEKAKYYAQKIIDYHSDFDTYINLSKEILSR